MLKADKVIALLIPVPLPIRNFPNKIKKGGEKQISYDEANKFSIKIIEHKDTQNHTKTEKRVEMLFVEHHDHFKT